MFNEKIPNEQLYKPEKIVNQIKKTFNRHLDYTIYAISDQKEELYGFFYENDFKIPFVYRKNEITIQLNINTNLKEKEEILSINEFKVKEEYFKKYIEFFTNIFIDDSISGFLYFCYLIDNINNITDDKSADMIITIKENGNLYYDFFCQHNKSEEFDLRVKFHSFKEKYNNSLALFHENCKNTSVIKNKNFIDCFTELLNIRFNLLNYKISKENIDLTKNIKEIIHTITEIKKIDNTIQY